LAQIHVIYTLITLSKPLCNLLKQNQKWNALQKEVISILDQAAENCFGKITELFFCRSSESSLINNTSISTCTLEITSSVKPYPARFFTCSFFYVHTPNIHNYIMVYLCVTSCSGETANLHFASCYPFPLQTITLSLSNCYYYPAISVRHRIFPFIHSLNLNSLYFSNHTLYQYKLPGTEGHHRQLEEEHLFGVDRKV
jgi:hypothetical protein